jgi:hypothetical protein
VISVAGIAAVVVGPGDDGVNVVASSRRPGNAPLSVTAETSLPGSPAGIAVGGGSVWVTTYDQVVRLNAGTAEIQDQIGPYGDKVFFVGHGLVVADDRVWVASPTMADGHDHGDYRGAVVRIDPSSGRIDGELRDQDDPPSEIVALDGGVWVAGNETLKLVDSQAGGYERSILLGRPAAGLAAGHGALWTASPSEGLVLRVDPEPGEVTTFDVGDGREELQVVAVEADGVWVADDDSVFELDPATGDVLQDVEVPGRINDAALDAGTLWIYMEDGVLALDADSGEVVARLDLPDRNLGKVVAADGQVWVTDYVNRLVRRIERSRSAGGSFDPNRGFSTERVTVRKPEPDDPRASSLFKQVHFGAGDGYDRAVFEFEGFPWGGSYVEYASSPDGLGDAGCSAPERVKGADLVVSFHGTGTTTGPNPHEGPRSYAGTQRIRPESTTEILEAIFF